MVVASQPIDIDGSVVCHISEGSTANPLQDMTKVLENLMTFLKELNHNSIPCQKILDILIEITATN